MSANILIVFLSVSALFGMFVTFIWSSSSLLNVLFKMVFAVYTLFACGMLLGVLAPIFASAGYKLY